MPHHGTPSPTLNLQIPSLHDSLPLSVRLYLPQSYTNPPNPPPPFQRQLAIVAHPYAPLGGSYDDFVVLRVVSVLIKTGWIVATFNFRGASGCKGKTSWTAKAEVKDYVSVVAWALAYVQCLPPAKPGSAAASPVVEAGEEEIALLLGGYSYGSLIASRLPGTEKGILPLLVDAGEGETKTAFMSALEAARRSARRWWDTHLSTRTSYSGSSVNRVEVLKAALEGGGAVCSPAVDSRGSWEDEGKKWRVTSRYLLISPLLPPVSSCLTGFGLGGGASWAKGLVGSGQVDGAVDREGYGIEEEGCEVLAVYGDGDTFTAVKKYRRWREKMIGERWTGVEVEGAGHFWHEEGVVGELERAVREWIEERGLNQGGLK